VPYGTVERCHPAQSQRSNQRSRAFAGATGAPCRRSGTGGGDHVVCGQTYFGDAHVLLVLTACFDRAFWKYRNHRKALIALMMDAAHLSQTLYLVATELGLGAFITAAVNNVDIEERLGLDGYVRGCSPSAASGGPLPNAHLSIPSSALCTACDRATRYVTNITRFVCRGALPAGPPRALLCLGLSSA
jgi:hypothetical protein